jgi:hypothetical protein
MTTRTGHRAAAGRASTGSAGNLRPPAWSPAGAAAGAVTAAGLILFFSSLRGVDLGRMNGLGLLSVLPVGAVAGVVLVALAFMFGLALPRAHRAVLGAALASLVVCLDGITAFVEPEPRFPTVYQIIGYTEYVSATGHTAPGLAAYFSWPGFFALVSFVTGATGTHSLLPLARIWPVAINLLCLPPLFLIMRNLRLSWRARWLAGFLFAVGNWVGQDYFSPQAFGYLLYLIFIAILVNWFSAPGPLRPPGAAAPAWPARLHRRLFGILEPGERPSRPAGPGQNAFLLALLIALFTVTAVSHPLTPLFMIGACAALVVARRCTLTGLPVLLAVILAGWISYETIAYWSGHLSGLVGDIGALGSNVSSSVGERLTGTPTHLLALRARVVLGAAIVGLAALGALRRRRQGMSDRVLLALLAMPLFAVAVDSYGGEIALRIYLFLLPAACPLAACLFFPGPQSARPGWRTLLALAACALVLPTGFLLARYGNEAFEQAPPGELAAMNWIYAHDADGARVLWLSTTPELDITPDMPWDYAAQDKVVYVPTLAPPDPGRVAGLISALRGAGPGSYLIVPQTEVASLQQTAGYAPDWGRRLNAAMSAAPGVQVAFSASSAVVYTLDWRPGARPQPFDLSVAGPALGPVDWNAAGVVLFWLVLALLMAREFMRAYRPGARLIRPCTLASLPLLALLAVVIVLRFALLYLH